MAEQVDWATYWQDLNTVPSGGGTWDSSGGGWQPGDSARAAAENATDDQRDLILPQGIGQDDYFPGLTADREMSAIYTPTGQELALDDPDWIITSDGYRDGSGAFLWDSYSSETRARLTGDLIEIGLLPKEFSKLADGRTLEQHQAWDSILSRANYYGITPFAALAGWKKDFRTLGGGRGRGGGGAGPSTAITIPDYPTLVQRTKELLRGALNGRDPEDWEMSIVADEMKRQYTKAAETQVQARLAGSGTFEIPDPVAVTRGFVEDRYKDEISRIEDVQETAVNNNTLIAAATRGAKMAGG